MRVDFGPVRLESKGFLRPDGSRWYYGSLDGWDSAETRIASMEPVGQHGEYVTDVKYAARGMVLRGVCVPGAADPWLTAEWLAGATDALDGQKTLTAYETNAKFVTARRVGRVRHEKPRKDGFEFEIDLLAEDPIKYSTVQKQATFFIEGGKRDKRDAETVFNQGNVIVFPERIRIWGSALPNIRIGRTDTKQDLVLQARPVGANEYNIFPQTREVQYGLPDAQRRRYDLLARGSQWWFLKKDGAATPLLLVRADKNANPLRATVYFRDGYV